MRTRLTKDDSVPELVIESIVRNNKLYLSLYSDASSRT